MATSRASRGANGDVARPPQRPEPPVADRITVALIPKAGEDLQRLQDRTSLSKTDLVNRAITLYEFIENQQRSGRELLLRNSETGELQTVLIL